MIVTLDFETYYAKDYSLTTLNTMEYCDHELFKVHGVGIKIDDEPAEWISGEEVEAAFDEIPWDEARLLCHNTPFDGFILVEKYGLRPSFYLDTQAMARALWPGQSASLKICAEREWPDDETMRKGDELALTKGVYDLDPLLEDQLAGYCVQDVELTYALWQRWAETFPESELELIDLVTRMFCDPGLMIDEPRLRRLHEDEVRKAKEAVAACGVDADTLSSNAKFAAHLESMGIVPPTKISPTTGKSIPALGKKDPGWIQLCNAYPQHEDLWVARTIAKSRQAETRALRLINGARKNGFIPAPLRYYAAHTGRFGGSEKINMQNFQRGGELRKSLVAPPGQLVYVADLSQIEARMLAWVAEEVLLVGKFADKIDVYSDFASTVYERPINKNDNPLERFVGKTGILGLGYGQGAPNFQRTLSTGALGPPVEISEEEARKVVRSYRNTHRKIVAFWRTLENLVRMSMNPVNYGHCHKGVITIVENGLQLPNGLALRFEGLRVGARNSLEWIRKGQVVHTYGGKLTENVVSALARIIITDAMRRLDKKLKGRGKVALQVHDEVIVVADDTDPDGTMQEIIDDLCISPSWAPDLPLAAEGGYATNYSK